jgi:HD superfamily phosphohydrolase
MKTIRDAIHGSIKVSDPELEILDTQEMQRLRRIRQLGFVYLVYPSATHTRFEHSIGTMHLAGELARRLEFSKGDTEKLRLAALLHDLGHGPYSHSSENAISAHVPLRHEEITEQLIKSSPAADHIKSAGYTPLEIAKISTGKKALIGEVIAGEIDVDRMDYLVRDAYYTGVAYGIIDMDRLLNTTIIKNRHLVFDDSGLSAVEGLVMARYLMYPTVYEHHTTRIVDAMFSKAITAAIHEKHFGVKELYEMDDYDVFSKLKDSPNLAGELIRRIEERRLYKRALVLDTDELGNYKKLISLNKSPQKLEKLESELTEACNLKPGELLLDIPVPLYREKAKIPILWKNEVSELSEVSPLVKALLKAQWRYWNVGVYTPSKCTPKAKKAKDILASF